MATEKQIKALEKASEAASAAFDAAKSDAPDKLELYAAWKLADKEMREAYAERGL